jgi:hypothetical protein
MIINKIKSQIPNSHNSNLIMYNTFKKKEIIIHGNDKKYIHRSTCNKCGYVFDQDGNEFMCYFYITQTDNVAALMGGIFVFCPKNCGGYGIMDTTPQIVYDRLIRHKENFHFKHGFCPQMISISQVRRTYPYIFGCIDNGYTIKCPIHGDVKFYNLYYKAGKRFMD